LFFNKPIPAQLIYELQTLPRFAVFYFYPFASGSWPFAKFVP